MRSDPTTPREVIHRTRLPHHQGGAGRAALHGGQATVARDIPRASGPSRGSTVFPSVAAPDFAAINRAALPHLESLCCRWLPGGKRIGHEWTCGSLRGEAGASCKVNVCTGRWADFATGEQGGDVVSLAAAIHRLPQAEAARKLARMFGIRAEGRRHG